MIKMIRLFTLFGLMPIAAQAGQMLLVQPTGPIGLRAPDPAGAPYGHSQAASPWHVGQWNNPAGGITDFAGTTARNDALSVTITPDGITIDQNSAILACTGPGGQPLEYDSFIGTNPLAPASVPLSAYTALTQSMRLTVEQAGALRGQACPVTKGVATATVVLANTSRHSTLFVQVFYYALNNTPRAFWWARGQRNGRYGYNIIAPELGSNWSGGPRRLSTDLLGPITRLITDNDVGMDPDPQHWVVAGAYFGTALYGHDRLRTVWQDYKLQAAWAH